MKLEPAWQETKTYRNRSFFLKMRLGQQVDSDFFDRLFALPNGPIFPNGLPSQFEARTLVGNPEQNFCVTDGQLAR